MYKQIAKCHLKSGSFEQLAGILQALEASHLKKVAGFSGMKLFRREGSPNQISCHIDFSSKQALDEFSNLPATHEAFDKAKELVDFDLEYYELKEHDLV